jgi:hypothetical protein
VDSVNIREASLCRLRFTHWLSELAVIVIGVLAALAVDDFAQYRTDRGIEAHLMERLEDDLAADAADLAIAQVQVARRIWLFSELERTLGSQVAPSAPADSLISIERAVALLEAVGRHGDVVHARRWDDPIGRPLQTLEGTPEFDLSDDSYQEMLAAGGMRTLTDPALRSAIIGYYRTAEDMGENAMSLEPYKDRFLDGLLRAGVASRDPMTFSELVRLLQRDPYLAAQAREAPSRLSSQSDYFDRIEMARVDLEEALALSRGR